MKLEDLRSFAGRDWSAIEKAKELYWIELSQAMSAAEALALADGLRRHVLLLQPDWPSEAERMEDAATHGRVSASLRLVR